MKSVKLILLAILAVVWTILFLLLETLTFPSGNSDLSTFMVFLAFFLTFAAIYYVIKDAIIRFKNKGEN